MVTPLGVDVGPGKGGHICSETGVAALGPRALEDHLLQLETDVLIAWDAPLTACSVPNGPLLHSDLTLRVLEKFLRQYHLPKGVAVQPYGSCSHWTITRRMLGLPRIGRYDSCSPLPFSLVSNSDYRPSSGRHVVEVHPAVALYFWFKDEIPKEQWEYKKNRKTLDRLWNLLQEAFPHCRRCWPPLMGQRRSICDDSLDAIVAWLLAKMWLDGDDVDLLGDERTGAILLPKDKSLTDNFRAYANVELNRREKFT